MPIPTLTPKPSPTSSHTIPDYALYLIVTAKATKIIALIAIKKKKQKK